MDESVKLFQEEQERFAKAGGPAAFMKRKLADALIGLFMLTLVAAGLMGGLGMLPRNSDNSIKIIYVGPVLIGFGAASAIALRRSASTPSWLRPSLWALVVLAVIGVPAGLIDAARLNGS